MGLGYYVLDGHTPRQVPMERWAELTNHRFRATRPEDDPWRVAWTPLGDGAVTVSTVFLGLDHAWGDGPPMLFETMIFGGGDEWDQLQWRYTSWDDAEAGHAAVVERLQAAWATPADPQSTTSTEHPTGPP
jgi:hypothetical protein